MAAKELAFGQEAQERLLAGIGKLARAVKQTLGPRGRNAILDKGWGSPKVTKDGVTVAEDIELSDQYETGIQVIKVLLQDVNPPGPVEDSFNEVNQAKQERERMVNDAEGQYNRVIPRARGEALQTVPSASSISTSTWATLPRTQGTGLSVPGSGHNTPSGSPTVMPSPVSLTSDPVMAGA